MLAQSASISRSTYSKRMEPIRAALWSFVRSCDANRFCRSLPPSRLAPSPWKPAPAATTGGGEIGKLGHSIKLIAPAYVKPFVKRQKNDASDAEAISEAAQRPTMRFVSVKSEEAQAAAIVFRTRDLLVRQRTQTINALRGHLAEFGMIIAKGPQHLSKLIAMVGDPTFTCRKPHVQFSRCWSNNYARLKNASPGLIGRSQVERRRIRSLVG